MTAVDMSVDRPSHSDRSEERIRLGFLDGLRGWAAVWVALYHFAICTAHIPHWAFYVSPILFNGALAVPLFIVLSGYSLMLPVARSAEGQLAGGLKWFFFKRARRTAPGYYAALVVSAVYFLLWEKVRTHMHTGVGWGDYAFGPKNWIAHVLMVHNWFPSYRFALDFPMWSVAADSDIYILFALLFLPCWRRFGPIGALAAGSAVGFLPIALFGRHAGYLYPWLAFLFTVGMAACASRFSERPLDNRLRKAATSWALPVVAVLLMYVGSRPAPLSLFPQEVGFGLLCGWVIAKLSEEVRHSAFNRFLSNRLSAWLARISYSLYLTHAFVSMAAKSIYPHLERHGAFAYPAMLIVGLAVSLVLAAIFSRLVEYPAFLYKKRTPVGALS